MTTPPIYRKKLIEVDLPLDAINAESKREKSIRHGHPSTLHLWWARRPLTSCRAVIFASMVDDPSSCTEEFKTEEAQRAERKRLHELIEQLVVWENTDEKRPEARDTLEKARFEIARSFARSLGEDPPDKNSPAEVLNYLNDKALPIYDPFAGGGSIPLEAQRLGLQAVASDLNPVAVLINKALIELPPKFRHRPPVNPEADPIGIEVGKGRSRRKVAWRGAAGLADDIRYYGRRMRELAWERIGHLYPKAKLLDGGEATVIAWLWARTVPCPNPACGVALPLIRSFRLSRNKRNRHWVKPVVDPVTKNVSIEVQAHSEGVLEKGSVNRNGAVCISCGTGLPLAYVRQQSRAGKMSEQMTAIVAEGDRKRLYVSPTDEHIRTALSAKPNASSIPRQKMPTTASLVSGRGYGITYWHELFTDRQLTALTTLSDLMPEIQTLICEHGADDEYTSAVCTYLALAISKEADYCSSYVTWGAGTTGENVSHVFTRQAIPMVWDFAEANPFASSTGSWLGQVEWAAKVVERLPVHVNNSIVCQADASTTILADSGPVIVTDPPYYDNISYAELSDFFYVWLRPLLRDVYPDLFAGIQVPIEEEMIAAPRFENARERFETLMDRTLRLIRQRCSPDFPSSIFYAYKQQEIKQDGRTSTGWDTMLTALVSTGFQIVGTWPMRTEFSARSNALNANSLASSVVLVCRPRQEDAQTATRRQFLDELEAKLPSALDQLTRESHIAPVDLRQAAIGPGMEVYSQYRRVETIGGKPVSVREALTAINRVVDEYNEHQEGDLDSETRFCIDWLKQYGYREDTYGEAVGLARAHNVSIEVMRDFHRLLNASAGSVRLLPLEEFGPDRRDRLGEMTAWEGAFRMAYHMSGREDAKDIEGAAPITRSMGSAAESVERLARILYNHFDRKDDSGHAVLFNSLVTEWPKILAEAYGASQTGLGL